MTFRTLNTLIDRFADYDPERVRLVPAPGTATLDDVIQIAHDEGKLCELIDGVLVEKTVGFKEAWLAASILQRIGAWVRQHDLGIVLGADGTTEIFAGQVRIPDVAFYTWDKLPNRRIPDEPIPDLVPDLAVEVISRSNSVGEMQAKRNDYLYAGVRLVWYVYPQSQTVEVYTATDASATYTRADNLTGGDVLPGFTLPLDTLFRE